MLLLWKKPSDFHVLLKKSSYRPFLCPTNPGPGEPDPFLNALSSLTATLLLPCPRDTLLNLLRGGSTFGKWDLESGRFLKGNIGAQVSVCLPFSPSVGFPANMGWASLLHVHIEPTMTYWTVIGAKPPQGGRDQERLPWGCISYDAVTK